MKRKALSWLLMSMWIQSTQAEELIVVTPDDTPPTLPFLEYLGSMVESDGELVGPEHFEETDQKTTSDTTAKDVWISKEKPDEK